MTKDHEENAVPFLHVYSYNTGVYEWGFDVPDGYLPAVGDRITLPCATPNDTESNTKDFVSAIVMFRAFEIDAREYSVTLDVDLTREMPEGMVPDSKYWPAAEHSKRQAAFLAFSKKYRRKKNKPGKKSHARQEKDRTSGEDGS